jgi:uncharacterized protein YndB with AHSA1/START domain
VRVDIKPYRDWHGVVYCEVLDVDEHRLLRYTWRSEEDGKPTSQIVAIRLRLAPVTKERR